MDINKNKNWIECAIEHYEDRCKRLDHKVWESKLLRHLKTYRSTAWKENRIQEIMICLSPLMRITLVLMKYKLSMTVTLTVMRNL